MNQVGEERHEKWRTIEEFGNKGESENLKPRELEIRTPPTVF